VSVSDAASNTVPVAPFCWNIPHSKLRRHVAIAHEGTFLVEGKSTYVFELLDGRQVKGHDLQQHREWPWRHSEHIPGVRYVRLRATSPTYGAVTLIVVDKAGADQGLDHRIGHFV
jgi:hypothetical protein